MIYVDYIQNKIPATIEFSDVYKALYFMKLGQKVDGVLITGWRCDYAEDNEFLNKHFTL